MMTATINNWEIHILNDTSRVYTCDTNLQCDKSFLGEMISLSFCSVFISQISGTAKNKSIIGQVLLTIG